MKLNKKALIFSILLSLITVLILFNYINNLKNQPVTTIEHTEVLTAINTIPAHVVITEDMIGTISIPSEAIHPEAVNDKSIVIGSITTSEIIKGEQILKSHIVTKGGGTSLSYQIPDDMRAITIADSEIAGVGGYIVPEDKIDILVNYSIETEDEKTSKNIIYTQFQNIEVLKVGPINAEQGGIPSSLTILVTPEQAEVVAFASTNGSFYFTLRNPMDKEKVLLDHFGSDNFNSWRDR
jgi:pilus assembly protein CpaB